MRQQPIIKYMDDIEDTHEYLLASSREIQLENNWSKIAFCLYGKGLVDMVYEGKVSYSGEDLAAYYKFMPVELNIIRIKTRFPVGRNTMISIGVYANLDRKDLHLFHPDMTPVDLDKPQEPKNKAKDVAKEEEPIVGEERTDHLLANNNPPEHLEVDFDEVYGKGREWHPSFLVPAPNLMEAFPDLEAIMAGDYMVMESNSEVVKVSGPVKDRELLESVSYNTHIDVLMEGLKPVKVKHGKDGMDIYLAESLYNVVVTDKEGDPLVTIEVAAYDEDGAVELAKDLAASHLGLEADKLGGYVEEEEESDSD